MSEKEIIGGEFIWSPVMLDGAYQHSVLDIAMKHHPWYHHHLTGGGYYSLKAILLHLKEIGKTRFPVLLPSFLCPTILKPFKELNIPYRFYAVDVDLQPDLHRMEDLFAESGHQAMLFIPYFGFAPSKQTRDLIEQIKGAGVSVIEDRAQCLFPSFEPQGDYVFYSFRKFLPVDGSLLLTQSEMAMEMGHDNHFYTAMRKAAQELRYKFIHDNEPVEEKFLELFRQAEGAYYQEGLASFEMTNLAVFAKTDIEQEITGRKRVWAELDNYLGEYSLLKDADQTTASPLCYPVVVRNRDAVRAKLQHHRIYAPVHWHLTHNDVPESFTEAHRLSSQILSLPVRGYMTTESCQKLAETFLKLVSS